jgi:hypothetical protein
VGNGRVAVATRSGRSLRGRVAGRLQSKPTRSCDCCAVSASTSFPGSCGRRIACRHGADEFLAGGIEGLRVRPLEPDRKHSGGRAKDRRAQDRARGMAGCGPKEGAADPAQEAAEITVELDLARERVCDTLGAPRSTISARQAAARNQGAMVAIPRRGPRAELTDDELVVLTTRSSTRAPSPAKATPR